MSLPGLWGADEGEMLHFGAFMPVVGEVSALIQSCLQTFTLGGAA